ncbi:MAG: DUF805 domain-containing protein [Deinococcales bacterium]|jgi:uncharacterized membrane protein YhaH (DUF805 family)
MGNFNPFKFNGRIGRLEYIGYGIVWGVVVLVGKLIVTGGTGNEANASMGGTLAFLPFVVVVLIATLSYGARRLHDFNQSAWLYLLMFVPIVNFFMALVLLFAPGTQGPNAYGVRGQ